MLLSGVKLNPMEKHPYFVPNIIMQIILYLCQLALKKS